MRFLEKIIAGDGLHKSRFHDRKGHRIDMGGMRYLPRCLLSTFSRITFGMRPEIPWLGYRVVERIEQIINRSSSILEFGSGMSTIWLAKRCLELVSLESNQDWFVRVKKQLRLKNINNVDIRFVEGSEYFSLERFPNDYFDFVLIDGDYRNKCAQNCIKKLKHGGYIYLDDTDKGVNTKDNEFHAAERVLVDAVNLLNGTLEYFVDFVPTYFKVTEGLLVQL